MGSFIVAAGAPCHAQAAAPEDNVLGQWLTAGGDSRVEIFRCGPAYCGRVAWMKEPSVNGRPRMDEKNPEVDLRSRPVQGLVIMRGFIFDGDKTWRGGRIYDRKAATSIAAGLCSSITGAWNCAATSAFRCWAAPTSGRGDAGLVFSLSRLYI